MRLKFLVIGIFLFALAPHPAQAIDLFKRKPDKKPEAAAVEKIGEDAKEKAPASRKAASVKKFYKGAAIGELKEYEAVYEDTLVKLARASDIGFVELRAANPGVDPWLPGAGVKLIFPTMHILPDVQREGIVINLPEMRLYYFDGTENPPASYPLGIGREGLATPIGKTFVRDRIEGPTWRPTKRMREEDPTLPESVPPGPDNPLGTHALYLGWPEYRIHGTNKPYGIGRRSSSGCIRMYPEDVVSLYPKVPVGTSVTVVDQPIKAAWIDDEFYVEVHPTMAQADAMEVDGEVPAYEISEDSMSIILRAAGKDSDLLDWEAIRTVVRERRGYPVVAGRRPTDQLEKAPEKGNDGAAQTPDKGQKNSSLKEDSKNVDTADPVPEKS
ncbi:MAG: L,D-transpeptidase family protein [Proteobacteria bacterium]|nr:L,D-transpeptidase family protein [Pseudomonadota bacterium]